MNELVKLQEKILTDVTNMPIIDSHDHLGPDENGIIPEFDLCDLIFHNLNSDLINAGMPGIGTHAQTPWPSESNDPFVKWHAINNYLKNIENLTSYKVLLSGIKELYDFPYQSISDSNWEMLNEQVTSAYKNKDWTDFVLKDKCKIIAVIIDMNTIQMDRNYFFPAVKLDYIMMGGLNPKSREKIETKHNTKIRKFEDFVELIHTVFENYRKAGAVAIKSAAAYYRSIKYDIVSFKEAQEIFDTDYNELNGEMEEKFQNFVMHEIMKLVNEKEMPIQIHTGKLAWNFQTIKNTNPVHLTDLLQKYRLAKFDLFHGGLPYANEFGILANNFPNVYLDLNGLMWTSLIITKKYLSEWIEMVPQNKILWGADSFRVLEGVVGQVGYFKKILSDVLADKIAQGYFDEEFALEFARKILYKNAQKFFVLSEKTVL